MCFSSLHHIAKVQDNIKLYSFSSHNDRSIFFVLLFLGTYCSCSLVDSADSPGPDTVSCLSERDCRSEGSCLLSRESKEH